MRKNWLIVVLATVLTLIAAFALVGMASAAGSSARPKESSAVALQAMMAPAATATPSGAMRAGQPTPTPTRKPAAKRKPTATATIPGRSSRTIRTGPFPGSGMVRSKPVSRTGISTSSSTRVQLRILIISSPPKRPMPGWIDGIWTLRSSTARLQLLLGGADRQAAE